MNNHFGKGLMAGLKATHADSAVNVTKFWVMLPTY